MEASNGELIDILHLIVIYDILVKKRSVVHCIPHLCLISTDYKVYDLCLTFTLQVSWGLGIDYMHSGSICSYGVVIFPEIKEHGYEKSGIMKYHNLPSYLSKDHLKVKELL